MATLSRAALLLHLMRTPRTCARVSRSSANCSSTCTLITFLCAVSVVSDTIKIQKLERYAICEWTFARGVARTWCHRAFSESAKRATMFNVNNTNEEFLDAMRPNTKSLNEWHRIAAQTRWSRPRCARASTRTTHRTTQRTQPPVARIWADCVEGVLGMSTRMR